MEQSQQQSTQTQSSSKYTLYQVAYIFMIIATVLTSFGLITMAWMIPMTIACKNCRDEVGTPQERPHVGLGICTLIFAGVISGILILVASGSE